MVTQVGTFLNRIFIMVVSAVVVVVVTMSAMTATAVRR